MEKYPNEPAEVLKEAAFDFFETAFRSSYEASQRGFLGDEEERLSREIKASMSLLRSMNLEPNELLASVLSALPSDGREIIIQAIKREAGLSEESVDTLRQRLNQIHSFFSTSE